MKAVVLVATLLLIFQACAASAADFPKFLKLHRQNQLPHGKVLQLPLNGTGQYMFHGYVFSSDFSLQIANTVVPSQCLNILLFYDMEIL
jgi:hypothetical protein